MYCLRYSMVIDIWCHRMEWGGHCGHWVSNWSSLAAISLLVSIRFYPQWILVLCTDDVSLVLQMDVWLEFMFAFVLYDVVPWHQMVFAGIWVFWLYDTFPWHWGPRWVYSNIADYIICWSSSWHVMRWWKGLSTVNSWVMDDMRHLKSCYYPFYLFTSEFRVEFPDCSSKEYWANVIAEEIFTQVGSERRVHLLLDEIVMYRTTDASHTLRIARLRQWWVGQSCVLLIQDQNSWFVEKIFCHEWPECFGLCEVQCFENIEHTSVEYYDDRWRTIPEFPFA